MSGLILLSLMSILCFVASYNIWPSKKDWARKILSVMCFALGFYFGLGAFTLYIIMEFFHY